MDTYTCLCTRRSIRTYDRTRPVTDEDLHAILTAASYAPSGANAQPWHFYVLRDRRQIDDIRTVIREHYHGAWWLEPFGTFFNAPCIVAACLDLRERHYHSKSPGIVRSLVDVSENPDLFALAAAVQNILLAAHARGLGSCWCKPAELYREELEDRLAAAPHHRVMAIVTLGYTDGAPPAPPRDPLDEFVTFVP